MSLLEPVLAGRERWAVVHDDNLTTLRSLPGASVHLAYLDAPFATQTDFHTDDGRFAYSDRWPDLDTFVASVIERCAAARDVLTDDGCLYLHVDPETSHYLKVALDKLFGRACFRNEIVWRYRRWPTKTHDFQRLHDVLFRYTKSPHAERWNQLYEPRSASTVETWGEGRQVAVMKDGRRVRSEATDEPSPGVPMSDVWELGILAPMANERTGYPTQKPRSLMDRIILSSTFPDDLVVEPYGGSAPLTAAAVAHGRRGIVMDTSPVAVEIATARLAGEPAQMVLGGMP